MNRGEHIKDCHIEVPNEEGDITDMANFRAIERGAPHLLLLPACIRAGGSKRLRSTRCAHSASGILKEIKALFV